MITRIEIDGFKSFRGFSMDFEPLLAIVGPNSAGKSNLVDALQLLSRLATEPLYAAFRQGRGRVRDQFSLTRDGTARRMSFALEVLLAPSLTGPEGPPEILHSRLRYEVEIERNDLPSGVEELNLVRERLAPIHREQDTWMAQHPEYSFLAHYQPRNDRNPFLNLLTGDARRVFYVPDNDLTSSPRILVPPHHISATFVSGQYAVLGQPHIGMSPHLLAMRLELRGWRFLHVDAVKLRLPSERAAAGPLLTDGSNLPTVLASLTPEVFGQVQADLASLVPGVSLLDVVERDDEFQLEVDFADGRRLPARLLSDGTLRILAFLVLLRTASAGAILGLEEPENGIFPGRLRAFIRKLQETTAPAADVPLQVLLNSHSPTVLAALHEQRRSIVFADLVRQRDGLRWTRMRRVAEGESPDRGATTVSLREIERILETAQPEGDE